MGLISLKSFIEFIIKMKGTRQQAAGLALAVSVQKMKSGKYNYECNLSRVFCPESDFKIVHYKIHREGANPSRCFGLRRILTCSNLRFRFNRLLGDEGESACNDE